MEDRKKAEILARLSNLETEYQMRILLAVEYGSRAYGCASDESDYDIRLTAFRSLRTILIFAGGN